ncbi:hypothetical protein QFZ58_000662 [Streptomyces sp. B1I3]|nr:hypothetical protein [Streptomyces sp. B1I3]
MRDGEARRGSSGQGPDLPWRGEAWSRRQAVRPVEQADPVGHHHCGRDGSDDPHQRMVPCAPTSGGTGGGGDTLQQRLPAVRGRDPGTSVSSRAVPVPGGRSRAMPPQSSYSVNCFRSRLCHLADSGAMLNPAWNPGPPPRSGSCDGPACPSWERRGLQPLPASPREGRCMMSPASHAPAGSRRMLHPHRPVTQNLRLDAPWMNPPVSVHHLGQGGGRRVSVRSPADTHILGITYDDHDVTAFLRHAGLGSPDLLPDDPAWVWWHEGRPHEWAATWRTPPISRCTARENSRAVNAGPRWPNARTSSCLSAALGPDGRIRCSNSTRRPTPSEAAGAVRRRHRPGGRTSRRCPRCSRTCGIGRVGGEQRE